MASKKDTQLKSDFKKLDNEQLTAETAAMRSKFYTLRTQATTEKVEDISQFKKLRKNIARALTEATARRHAAAAKK